MCRTLFLGPNAHHGLNPGGQKSKWKNGITIKFCFRVFHIFLIMWVNIPIQCKVIRQSVSGFGSISRSPLYDHLVLLTIKWQTESQAQYWTCTIPYVSNHSDKWKRRKKDANIIFWARLFSRTFIRVLCHLDQARSWGLRRGVCTDANIS